MLPRSNDPSGRSAESFHSAQPTSSGGDSFAMTYSDGGATVRNDRPSHYEDVRGEEGEQCIASDTQRPASNTGGTGMQVSPPTPTPKGGVEFDNMEFHATEGTH